MMSPGWVVQCPLVSSRNPHLTLDFLMRIPAAAPGCGWCWTTNFKVNSVLGEEKLFGQSLVLILNWHEYVYFDEFGDMYGNWRLCEFFWVGFRAIFQLSETPEALGNWVGGDSYFKVSEDCCEGVMNSFGVAYERFSLKDSSSIV